MSSSIPLRFLCDENVRVELDASLKTRGFDVNRLPKGSPDKMLSILSQREQRILVTNDRDFTLLSEEKIFAVVWLRIPQQDLEILISSFQKLLAECRVFAGNLITLDNQGWKNFPLRKKMEANND